VVAVGAEEREESASVGAGLKKNPLLVVLILALAASFCAWLLSHVADPAGARASESSRARIVSLAPAVTETLFAIGAGPSVVGVSDYCDQPPEARSLPRLGSSLTPGYERIARLAPNLIVSEANASTRDRELGAIARTRLLPWLTLDEIVGSTRELGRLTGRERDANQLAERLRQRLDVPAPPGAPRVLLVLGYQIGKLDEVWFIRKNSLHGAALHAAGGRNAVDQPVSGLPRLGLERLLEIDPDLIVVLTPRKVRADDVIRTFSVLPALRAVRAQRVAVLEAPEAFANGPRILGMVDRLSREIAAFGSQRETPSERSP
jgi:ABC-type Fe3+-hydroxamate transport system substrate-binding protein